MRNATTKEVAAALHVEPTTVQRYARDGRIPFDTTPGGHRRFDVDEVIRFLDSEDATFVARRDFVGLGDGRDIVRSRTSSMLLAARTTRAEEVIADGTAHETTGTALDDLIGHARRVMVATAR